LNVHFVQQTEQPADALDTAGGGSFWPRRKAEHRQHRLNAQQVTPNVSIVSDSSMPIIMFLQFQQPAPIRLVQVLTDAQNSTSTLESNKELRERCEQEFGVRPQMRIVKVPMISEQVRVKFVDVELNLPQVNHETGVSICGDEAALKAHQFDSYFVMNTHGKTHLAVLHEYAQKVLKVFFKKY
jgi:metal-dependent HD superfamily phosphatase/phosphodiesterase